MTYLDTTFGSAGRDVSEQRLASVRPSGGSAA
jgi:hypothetical protein